MTRKASLLNFNVIQFIHSSTLWLLLFAPYLKKTIYSKVMKILSFFPPQICIALLFLLRHTIYQEWLLCSVWGENHDAFFLIGRSNQSSTLWWKDHPSQLLFSVTFAVFQVTIYMNLFLDSLFCSSNLLSSPLILNNLVI